MGLSDIAKAPVSHGVEPHDLETGPDLRVPRQPMARSPRSSLLPRERFSPRADSVPTGVASGRTGVRAKAAALRARNSVHRPKRAFRREADVRRNFGGRAFKATLSAC